MVTLRPTKQFEFYNHIKRELSDDKELMKLSYIEKKKKVMEIYYYLNKLIETDIISSDLELNFNNVLGEIIFNDDTSNPLCNNCYDALITESGRNKVVKVRFCGEKTIKVQFKMLQPKALDRCISLPEYQVKKYVAEKCSIILLIKNNSDPSYYNKDVRNLMYFPDNKITSEGYQYYLIPYNKLLEGNRGEYNNYFYEVKHNGRMFNIGLRYKLGQLNLKDFPK